ncbi:SDR family oxidoreductase [Paraburkholderia hospita]|uniref:SDR family oxidoreductase n=1 Tax=Paraburkholderia hospita TaxID=169430 RepID=UPI00390893EF
MDEVVAAITAAGGDATSLVVDVTKEDDVAAMVRLAVDTYGKLDIARPTAGTHTRARQRSSRTS